MRVLMILIMLFFIGCQDKKQVPVVIDLSGNYSSIGMGLKNGILLAEDNDIHFKFYDDKGDLETTKNIDKKLILEHKPLVIGHVTSSITQKVLPLFNKSKTILFSPTASTKELAGIDDNFVRIQPVKNFHSIANVLKYISTFTNSKKINVVYEKGNKAYVFSLISALKDKRNKYLKLNKVIGANKEVPISKIDKNIPLCIISSPKFGAELVKKLAKTGFNSFIILSGSAFTKEFITLAGEAGEGVLFFTSFNPNSEDKKYLEFKDKFISRFGYEPGSFELKGYEIAQITKKVIDKKNIKKALINHTFNGIQGKIHVDKYGDTIRETHIFIVNNSTFEKVE